VAVGSIQTVDRRLKKHPLNFDLVIIDEAHHAVASTWARVIAQFPSARILGVTATACRTDGSGLGLDHGGIFDDLIVGPAPAELIADGFLVKPVVYAPPTDIDLTGVKRRGGDYNPTELATRVDRPTVTGSAVEHYRRLAPGEPAIAFCASIQHAMSVTESFRAAGYTSEVIHGKLDDFTRRSMIEGLAKGTINVLTSVDLISEGTDIPVVSVGILLRPTQSMGLHLQQCGRILRTAPNKSRALILDHVGNCLSHGLPESSREWTLAGETKKKQTDEENISVRQCKKCFSVWERGAACPYCGHAVEMKPRKIDEREGELTQLTAEHIERAKRERRQEVGRARTREEIEKIARERGYAPGWIHKQMQLKRISR
jgi:DNA repair protein RadD